MIAAMQIADHPELLTPDWLTEAMRPSGVLGSGAVASADVAPLGTGQMCDSVRIRLDYVGDVTPDAPTSVVAKLPAADETSRQTGITLRSYEKEVRFYQEVAPTLDVRVPRLFHADIEVGTGSFVLLLGDAAPAEQGDQLAGCSPEVAESALAELVGLHAPRWGDASLREIEWLFVEPAEYRANMAQLLPMLWAGFADRYAEVLDPAAAHVGTEVFAKLDSYLDESTAPATIVHGDYRLDNLLIDPRDASITVVDWQTVALGAAATDAAYFVGAGLLADDRRAHEERLVRGYHEALVAAGVEGYGWDECWTDYRRGTFAGLMMAVAASMLVERTERGDRMFMAMASRHAQHALDLDALDLVD